MSTKLRKNVEDVQGQLEALAADCGMSMEEFAAAVQKRIWKRDWVAVIFVVFISSIVAWVVDPALGIDFGGGVEQHVHRIMYLSIGTALSWALNK